MSALAWSTPAARLVLRVDAPRAAWLARRRDGLGGSDASTLAGVNPWSSGYELWLDKTGQLPDALATRDTDAMHWGRRLEPVIAEWFSDATGIPTRRAGLMASRERPWQLASVDRLTGDGGLLEIKTTSWRGAADWEDDQVADHAEVQAQHYLAVTGRPHAHVVALVDGRQPLLRRVERDDDLIGALTSLEERFWCDHVAARVAPPLTAAALPALKARYSDVRAGTSVEGDPEQVRTLLSQLAGARAEARAAETAAAAAEAQLRGLLGTAEQLTVDGELALMCRGNGPFSESRLTALRPDLAAEVRTTRDVLDVQRLKTDHPDVYAACRARVLRPARQTTSTRHHPHQEG